MDRALVEALGPGYRDRLTEVHTDVDLSTPLRQLVMPFRVVDDEVEVLKDIAYDATHGKRGLLDVYRRRGSGNEKAPVLLQVHGGGWSVGDKEHQGIPLMLHMAARGWVCVAVNYRLSPRDAFPAHLVDVKRAIAWVREHGPSYGADPSFLAVTGGSAGGHLTALAALTPNDPEYQPGFEDADTTVQAAVPFYGVYDFAGITGSRRAQQMRDRFLGPRVLFRDPRREIEHFERASPLLRVGPDAPPMFVIHGTHDSLVEVSQAREFVARLREVSKHEVAYAELPGTQHAFDVFPSIRSAHVTRGVDRFLRWTYDAAVRAADERTAQSRADST
ncbi:MAG: alpha/beta hydrolase [Nocardioides sp.]